MTTVNSHEELQTLISQIVARVLSERAAQPSRPPVGRVLVAVCCDECLDDTSRAAINQLKSQGYDIALPAETEFANRARREEFIRACDAVLLPGLGDSDAAKMAHGIFDDPVSRIALAALVIGKPVITVIQSPYEALLKQASPSLSRVFTDHQRALRDYGFKIISGDIIIEAINQACAASLPSAKQPAAPAPGKAGKRPLVTAGDVEAAARAGSPLAVPPGALITPLAKDRARELGMAIGLNLEP